jgi:uncharacterized protein
MALPPPTPGSTSLVTGASSGIGSEIARGLARRGHGITLVARRAEALEELAEELRQAHGVRTDVLDCDISDPEEVKQLVASLEQLELAVEVLVNNAGIGTGGRFHELDTAGEITMVRLNAEAVVALCGAFLPGMVERGRGAVLNVASTTAFQPLPTEATYGATKAFVLNFTEALHGEYAGTGIAVTALCPGPVKTEFMEGPGIEAGASNLPSAMWVDAADVAERGIRGLERGRRVVVPGALNRAGAFAGRHVHRGMLLRVARRVTASTH